MEDLVGSTAEILAWAAEHATADDDWARDADRSPAVVRPWPDSPKGVLFGTKADCLWRMLPDLAPGFSTYTKYGPVPAWLAKLVEHDPAAQECVIFVGDLDPQDLLAFATMLERATLDVGRVHFAGPIDPWLDALSVEHKKIISLSMSDFELGLWERVRELDLDWSVLLGPHGLALLESGHKIELEGAMNPEIYGEAFTRWAGARILNRWS